MLVGKKPDCQEKPEGEGQLLGGRFFEWNPHNLNDTPRKAPYNLEQKIEQKNPHVIIILYPNLEEMKNAAALIDHWMQLFCHRHKILWAYVQSRLIKRELEAEFVEVQSYVKDFKIQGYEGYNLSQLSKKVSDADNLFSDYAINLSYLEFQRSTIEVNLDSYRQQLRGSKNPCRAEFRASFEEFDNSRIWVNALYFTGFEHDHRLERSDVNGVSYRVARIRESW